MSRTHTQRTLLSCGSVVLGRTWYQQRIRLKKLTSRLIYFEGKKLLYYPAYGLESQIIDSKKITSIADSTKVKNPIKKNKGSVCNNPNKIRSENTLTQHNSKTTTNRKFVLFRVNVARQHRIVIRISFKKSHISLSYNSTFCRYVWVIFRVEVW